MVSQTCCCHKLPCVTHTVPPRSNQIRTTPETFSKAEVSLVNRNYQTTSLHQLRTARHRNTQRRQHQRQRRRHNTAQHDATTQRHITQCQPHKTTTTNTPPPQPTTKTSHNNNQPQPNNSNSIRISNSNSFRNSNRNNGQVRRGCASSLLSLKSVYRNEGHWPPFTLGKRVKSNIAEDRNFIMYVYDIQLSFDECSNACFPLRRAPHVQTYCCICCCN